MLKITHLYRKVYQLLRKLHLLFPFFILTLHLQCHLRLQVEIFELILNIIFHLIFPSQINMETIPPGSPNLPCRQLLLFVKLFYFLTAYAVISFGSGRDLF